MEFAQNRGREVYNKFVQLSKVKVQLKFFFPVLIKMKSFREASSHISSPYLKRKNFGGKQNFPPKSCFPNSETKRANSTASVEKACLNYRKIIRQQQIYQLLTHFRLPAKLCPKCNEAQQQTYCFSAGNLFKSIITYHHRSFGIVFTKIVSSILKLTRSSCRHLS